MYTEEQIKQNIAQNITKLRKKKGMTQLELADALNYSDKSISKWERGEGIPDVLVLCKIAELFKVSLNGLISEKPTILSQKKLPNLSSRIIIPLLSVGLVFLIFSLVFFALKLIIPEFRESWLLFILAIPVSCIPLLVFSCLWWKLLQRFICVTALSWSTVLFLCLCFDVQGMNTIIITASIFQILVVLWFIMRYRSKRRKEKQQKDGEIV